MVVDICVCYIVCFFYGMGCSMVICDVCGNDYDKSFIFQQGGCSGMFDLFECVIYVFVLCCVYCDCVIIGYGVEGNGCIFCCVYCVGYVGVKGIVDWV